MATPNTKAALKEHCLRSLGKPVIDINVDDDQVDDRICLLYTSPSPRDATLSRMPSSA